MQPRRPLPACLAGLLLATCSATVLADEPTTLSLGSGLAYRHLEEFDRDGRRLLTESGPAPALGLEIGRRLGPGTLFGGLGVRRYALDYDGQSQRGRPLETRSDYFESRLWTGYRFEFGDRWSLGLRWERSYAERDIRATAAAAGLEERYNQDWAAIGLRHRLARGPVEWVEAEWHRSIGGTLRVSSPGVIDPVWIPLGASRGFSISARIPLGAAGWFSRIDLEPGFSHTRSEASESRNWRREGVAQGSINEPEHEEWQLGAGLRLSW